MKVVLDTNVVVSGLLSPFGAPGEIVRMSASGDIELCYDARILCEYRDVLSRSKFSFNQTYIENLLDQIKARGYIAAAKPLIKRLPDADDEPFLEVALAGKAEYLVTINLKHYPENKQQGMIVISPEKFLEVYRKRK